MPRSILIVDDEPIIAATLAALLNDEGYRVQRAANGRQALDHIDRDPPDLILTDVMMPLVDGVTLTRTLRDRGDGTPVVLMSAGYAYADVDIPGVRFLPKPFDLEAVVAAVGQAVEETGA